MQTQIVEVIDIRECIFSGRQRIMACCKNGNIISIPLSFIKEGNMPKVGDKIEILASLNGDKYFCEQK